MWPKSRRNYNTKRLKALFSFFQFEHQLKGYIPITNKTDNEGRNIVTKSFIDHTATYKERYILKS